MKKLGEGHKSEVFLLPDGRILKLFFPHFAYLAPAEREIADALARAGVRAPRVGETMTLEGRPGLVFEGLEAGETLSEAVRARPWTLARAAHSLAERHAEVHACASTELASQRERLDGEIRAARGVPERARSLALAALEGLPDGDTVCHNDIHMLNVIVSPAGPMIIDWVLATRGNPLADVAGAVLQLRFGDRPRGLAARTALELGRAAFWRAYLRRYLRVRAPDEAELQRWELPVAVALAGRREGRMRRQLLQRIDRLIGREQSQPVAVRS